ncbi:hypothetical protein AMECASPLE_022189 [Ameca splendens]|uniref:Heme-binding protein 1 n=1 Tax=Ameca splendens TaxID=208324 RepID=A0ABV0Z1S8_9TELE
MDASVLHVEPLCQKDPIWVKLFYRKFMSSLLQLLEKTFPAVPSAAEPLRRIGGASRGLWTNQTSSISAALEGRQTRSRGSVRLRYVLNSAALIRFEPVALLLSFYFESLGADKQSEAEKKIQICSERRSSEPTWGAGATRTRPVSSLTSPADMALISLDDLEGLDDEQVDDDIIDDPEPMDEEERERLLSHWQAVASTHQVSVPAEMTGPIQEMTRNSQQREALSFVLVARHEKMGEVLYEERLYPAGNWATVTSGEDLYEQSISMAFMKLMRFICKENSSGRYLGLTVPVVSSIQMMKDAETFDKNVETAFFLPTEFQSSAPHSSDPDISITYREPIRVIARTFYGTTTEQTVSWQIRFLWELLDLGDAFHRERYMVAVYDNPGALQRRNEIWFIRRD